MNFKPGNFQLKSSPLALVFAQFSLGSPLTVEGEALRDCLSKCGLEKLTRKYERNLTVSAASPAPIVQDRTVNILLDQDSQKGLSFAQDSVAFFSSDHNSFESLLDELSQVIGCLSMNGNLKFTSVALRYVNAFEITNDPTEVVKDSLGGLERTGFDLPHYHHNYEFWCETKDGRLHTRFATDHGDRKPKQLGHAEVVYPNRCLWSCERTIGHLDIFETSKNLSQKPIEWPGVSTMLKRMNLNIEQAFLNAVKAEALVGKFGAEVKK